MCQIQTKKHYSKVLIHHQKLLTMHQRIKASNVTSNPLTKITLQSINQILYIPTTKYLKIHQLKNNLKSINHDTFKSFKLFRDKTSSAKRPACPTTERLKDTTSAPDALSLSDNSKNNLACHCDLLIYIFMCSNQCCGAGAGRSPYFLVGAGVKVRLRLQLR